MDKNQRIIVIGASAGGVDALRRVASQLPGDFPAPILVVLHIGAHRSHLPELLTAAGPLNALHAETGMVPEAGTIYVAPPDRHLLLQDGRLIVHGGPKEHHSRPAINPLFRSAALDAGARVIGIVLTGMLDDGSAGLRAIHACGGTTMVQDPDEAVEPSMPRSALSALVVNHVLRLDAMADELNRLARPATDIRPVSAPEWLRVEHAISMGSGSIAELATIGIPSQFSCPDCGGVLFELEAGKPLRFLCHTGHAFSLRSLAKMQEQVTDYTLWSSLRALQEKVSLLQRIAVLQAAEAAGAGTETLEETARLQTFIDQLRKIVGSVPPGVSAESEAHVL